VLDPEFARPATKALWSAITCAETRDACETIERFATFCVHQDQSGICRSINAAEAEALWRLIATAGQWLERMAASLASEA